MYDQQRTDWWLERSSAADYKEAFERVAAKVRFQGDGAVIDVACGPGFQLAALYQRAAQVNAGSKRKKIAPTLIGTDQSEDMLALAERNLSQIGIQSQRIELPEEAVAGLDRVYLMQDDLAASKVPDEYAAAAILTFPELHFENLDPQVKQDLKDRFFKAIGTPLLGPEFGDIAGVFLVAKMVRPYGQLIHATFSTSTGRTAANFAKKGMDARARVAGLRNLERFLFFENDAVYEDVGMKAHAEDKKGYMLRVFRK